MKIELLHLQEIDSTNTYLKTQTLPFGTVAYTQNQTAGRGRMGRSWQGGGGVALSVLVPTGDAQLPLIASIAAARVLQNLLGLPMQIKWPNDILLNGKKLVGILTEMDCDMEKIHSVTVGMGINVNTKAFPEDLQDIATSLYLVSCKEYDRAEIVGCVLKHFEALYEEFLEKGGVFAPFKERYRERCLNIGKEVRVIGRETYLATALDITPEGELIVKRMDNGAEEVVFSGEVSIREKE